MLYIFISFFIFFFVPQNHREQMGQGYADVINPSMFAQFNRPEISAPILHPQPPTPPPSHAPPVEPEVVALDEPDTENVPEGKVRSSLFFYYFDSF